MKKLILVTAEVGLLQYLKPIERIPKIGQYAPFIETGVGIAGAYFLFKGKSENSYLKATAEAMIISGTLKLINKYVPKVV